MPTSVIVMLAALIGMGAALVGLALLQGDVVLLVIGAVVVGLGVRLRRQVAERLAEPADSETGNGGSGSSSGAAGTSGAAAAAAAAPSDDEDDEDDDADALVGEAGLTLSEGEAATIDGGDGSALHGSGLAVCDAATGERLAGEWLRLRRDGAQVVRVFSSEAELEDLQADELAPGRDLVLVPQRSREGRVEAVRVFDEAIDHLAGWLPDKVVAGWSAELRRSDLPARSLYEWRDDDGRRRALDVLVHRRDAPVEA